MWPDPLPIESIVKAWEFWSRWSMWDDLMISTCFHDCVRCVWCVWCTNEGGAGGVAQGQSRLQNLWTLPVTFKVLQGTQWHRNFRVGISWLRCHHRHYSHYRHYHVSLIAAGLVSYSPMCSKTSMIHNRHPIGPGHDSQTGSDIIWVSWGPQCFELWCMCNLCNTLKHGESHEIHEESTGSTGSTGSIHEVHHVFQAAPVGRSLSEVHGHLEVRTGKVTKTQSDSLRIDSIDMMQKVE